MKILFAIDCSYSIKGKKLYFNELEKIMDKYYKNGDIIYIWNDAYEEYEISKLTTSFKELCINYNKGNGSTHSEKLAEILKDVKEYREHLVIITDGEVEEKV